MISLTTFILLSILFLLSSSNTIPTFSLPCSLQTVGCLVGYLWLVINVGRKYLLSLSHVQRKVQSKCLPPAYRKPKVTDISLAKIFVRWIMGHLYGQTYVRWDICMLRYLYGQTFVWSDICMVRHLYAETFVCRDICMLDSCMLDICMLDIVLFKK